LILLNNVIKSFANLATIMIMTMFLYISIGFSRNL